MNNRYSISRWHIFNNSLGVIILFCFSNFLFQHLTISISVGWHNLLNLKWGPCNNVTFIFVVFSISLRMKTIQQIYFNKSRKMNQQNEFSFRLICWIKFFALFILSLTTLFVSSHYLQYYQPLTHLSVFLLNISYS